MKKIARLLVFLLFAASSLKAQKVYFIYLQTDNQQPFYVRLGERILNSASNGYLIVPNLRDSTYSMRVGISGSQQPDQLYSLTVNRKDQGFIIKDFGEKGWGLFNINSMAVIMPQTTQQAIVQAVKTEKRESNPFTDLLAKAADDSTIKEKPIVIKAEEKKPETINPQVEKKEEIKTDSINNIFTKSQETKKEIEVPAITVKEIPIKTDSIIKIESEIKKPEKIKTDSVIQIPVTKEENKVKDSVEIEKLEEKPLDVSTVESGVYKRSEVKLKSESSTTMGIGLIFLDILSEDRTDTIKILIPPTVTKQSGVEIKQEEKRFLDIPAGDTSSSQMPKVISGNQVICRETATEEDFINLRRKMVGESNDDAMISEAKKVYKTKCFTTQQIKNLSSLFLIDESKYKFFDASYGVVIDPANFSTLESELKDSYFVNRFKAMLRL